MTLQEIKAAELAGKKVYWSNDAYEVVHDNKDQWLIVCSLNGYTIGLTWLNGVSMNGNESEFYIGE